MVTDERMIVKEGARYWWVFLVSGIAWLLIAWMVLRLNSTSLTTVGVLLGVVFLLAGINEVGVATLSTGGWKIWHYILAVIFFLGALYGFIRPVNTFFALASVLGLILFLYGAFEIIQAIASRAVNPYWWLGLIMGILLVLLAFWVSGSDRVYALGRRTYLILFWVGFMALFRGISQIFMAFTVRHAGHEAATALGDASPG
ncbi:HdeD family acid-resistance protein [Kribbella sp. CWNU-51]